MGIKLRELALRIEPYAGERRTVYEQLDGSVILASECTCDRDPFTCPIDKHGIDVRQRELDL
jgi:hypothetical protein